MYGTPIGSHKVVADNNSPPREFKENLRKATVATALRDGVPLETATKKADELLKNKQFVLAMYEQQKAGVSPADGEGKTLDAAPKGASK